jgi:hypothetical protein
LKVVRTLSVHLHKLDKTRAKEFVQARGRTTGQISRAYHLPADDVDRLSGVLIGRIQRIVREDATRGGSVLQMEMSRFATRPL